MSVLDALRKKLEAIPNLAPRYDGDRIVIEVLDVDGFEVGIEAYPGGFGVWLDTWYEELSDKEMAIELFLLGLSKLCRLKVISRGRRDIAWILEVFEDGRWVAHGRRADLLVPFWLPKHVRYLQNRYIE